MCPKIITATLASLALSVSAYGEFIAEVESSADGLAQAISEVFANSDVDGDDAQTSTHALVQGVSADGWRAGVMTSSIARITPNDDTLAQLSLSATAEGACHGGGDDECGAQILMSQRGQDGVQLGSEIDVSAATVRLNGRVALGSVGENGGYIGDVAQALTGNTSGIATNLNSISSLQSGFANFQTETADQFARIGSDMHRGLAEVIAISNIAYADEGLRASVGYGNYESKSATAFGISYAGERFKFKVSRGGKATGAGMAFDF